MASKYVGGKPVPVGALIFDAALTMETTGEGAAAKRTFSAVAYSGEVIKNHWWWESVVFDLSTTKSPQNIPALLNHRSDEIVGFATKVEIADDIRVEGDIITTDVVGKKVADFADAGFPWQMSVHIEPSDILEIPKGFSQQVNGRIVNGPCYVFSNSTIVEASFTPTGADPNTSAKVFNRDADHQRPIKFTRLESNTMTPEEKIVYDAAIARTAALEADAAAAITRMAVLETEAANAKFSVRKERMRTAFTRLGMEFDDDIAGTYRTLDDETFTKVATKFEAMKPVATKNDSDLFKQKFTGEEKKTDGTDENPVVKFSRELAAKMKKSPIAV